MNRIVTLFQNLLRAARGKGAWVLPLALTSLLLSGCPPTLPIEITKVTVKPAPLIGEVVTVRFEFMSTEDEPDTHLEIDLQEGVKLVSGSLTWQGSLTANQVQSHEIDICTQYEGTWRVRGSVWSVLGPDNSYTDVNGVFLEVSENAARVLSAEEYETDFKGKPGEVGSSRMTPLPELATPVCP